MLELHTQGTTAILSTHDETLAQKAGRQIRIVGGRIFGRSFSESQKGEEEDVSASIDSLRHVAVQKNNRYMQLLDGLSETISATTRRWLRTLFLVTAVALGIGDLIGTLGISESAFVQVTERLT